MGFGSLIAGLLVAIIIFILIIAIGNFCCGSGSWDQSLNSSSWDSGGGSGSSGS